MRCLSLSSFLCPANSSIAFFFSVFSLSTCSFNSSISLLQSFSCWLQANCVLCLSNIKLRVFISNSNFSLVFWSSSSSFLLDSLIRCSSSSSLLISFFSLFAVLLLPNVTINHCYITSLGLRAVSTHFELAKTTHFFPPTHSNFFYQLIQLIHFSITNSFNSFKK